MKELEIFSTFKIEENDFDGFKINNIRKYKLDIFLQVDKENTEFIKLVNTAISTFREKEKNNILNNYQLILYHKILTFYTF